MLTRADFAGVSITSPSYRQTVSKIVLKARLACSQAPLNPEDFILTVEAWTEALAFADVPEEKLNRYYLIALKTRESTFPLGVSEIIAVWDVNKRPSFMAPAK